MAVFLFLHESPHRFTKMPCFPEKEHTLSQTTVDKEGHTLTLTRAGQACVAGLTNPETKVTTWRV